MQTRIRSLALATLASAIVATPALGLKGPPWISIELPANPYDKSTRDAFLLVHSFHQGPEDAATAVVELGPDGDVAAIRVPTMQRGEWTVPAPVSLGDIDAALRARAATLARRS